MTLAMLTLGVVLAYVVMEVLDWARSETLREAGVLFDRRMAPRVFQAMYENNLRRLGPTSVQPMNDLRTCVIFPAPSGGCGDGVAHLVGVHGDFVRQANPFAGVVGRGRCCGAGAVGG